MNLFKKINIDLSDLVLKDFNSGVCLHNPNGLGLSYFKLKNKQLLIDRLPEELPTPFDIFYCIMTGPGKLFPHIDTHTTTAINYYIEGASGVTTFYKLKENASTTDIKNSFSENDVIEVDRFIANDGECYLLNVKEIHNVELPSASPRHFINFAFKDVLWI